MNEPRIEPQEKRDQSDAERTSFYWDWNKHEDNIFTNRGSFFLVGQSMLIAATSALMAAGFDRLNVGIVLLASTGLLLTVVHLIASTRHIQTQRMIKEQLRIYHPLWTSIYHKRLPFPRAAFLIGIVVPAIVLSCWIGLLLLAITKWAG